jgi:hypothetical protein
VAAGALLDRIAVVLHAPHAAHHRIEFGHFECNVIERRQIRLGQDNRGMIAAGAMQEPERRIIIDDTRAERRGEELQARVELAGVEIDMGDLARAVGLIVGVRMIGDVADKREVAAVGILAGEAAAGAGEPRA